MTGFNPGAFVSGHEAGMNRQQKQEQLKLQKQQFQMQQQQHESNMNIQDAQLEKLKQENESFKQVTRNMERVKGYNIIKRWDPDKAQESVDALNEMSIVAKKGGNVSLANDEQIKKYLANTGYEKTYYDIKKEEDGTETATPVSKEQLEAMLQTESGRAKYADIMERANKDLNVTVENLRGLVLSSANGSDVISVDDLSKVLGAKLSPIAEARFAKKAGMDIDISKSGTKAQSSFGKFFADMTNLGVDNPDKILELYSMTEKNPDYGQAIRNLIAKGNSNPSPEDIDTEVRAIKGTLPTQKDKGAPTAVSSINELITMTESKNLDVNSQDFLGKFKALPTKDKEVLRASAEDYFKASDQKLMDKTSLGKHLHTLKNIGDVSKEAVKEAAGVGDSVANEFVKYFDTNEGIEFKKKFQQTFNSLLGLSNKGHISRAELDNLEKAFGGMSSSNEVVFSNFKSMIEAMKSNVDAYINTNEVAGKILYGNEANAYQQIIEAMNNVQNNSVGAGSVRGNSNTITTDSGTTVPSLDMSGAE